MNYKMIPVFKGGVASLVPTPIEPVVAPQPGVRPNGRTVEPLLFGDKVVTSQLDPILIDQMEMDEEVDRYVL